MLFPTPSWAKPDWQNRQVSNGIEIITLGYEITTLPAGIKKPGHWLQSLQ